MIRISPSLLQRWLDLQSGAYNTNIQALEAYIFGVMPPSLKASRGTAYHLLLENGGDPYRVPSPDGGKYEVPVLEKGIETRWTFSQAAAQPALDLYSTFEGMSHEVWLNKEYDIEGEKVTSWMKIDGLELDEIHEFKTSSAPKGWLDYYPSIQWKCYLLALPDALTVHYHNFALNEDNTKCTYRTFSFERYPEMEADVLAPLGTLVRFLKTRPDLYAALEKKAIKEPA